MSKFATGGLIVLMVALTVMSPFFEGLSDGKGTQADWFQATIGVDTLIAAIYAAVSAKKAADQTTIITERTYLSDQFHRLAEQSNQALFRHIEERNNALALGISANVTQISSMVTKIVNAKILSENSIENNKNHIHSITISSFLNPLVVIELKEKKYLKEILNQAKSGKGASITDTLTKQYESADDFISFRSAPIRRFKA